MDTNFSRREDGARGPKTNALTPAGRQARGVSPGGEGRRRSPEARLAGLATAWPPHVLRQEEVAANGAEMFATTHGGFERLAPIYRNALIET